MKLKGKLKQTLLTALGLIFWIFLSNIIAGDYVDNKIGYNEIKHSMIVKENPEYQNLKQYLYDLRGSKIPWISRKEIASWSATILYLTVILIVLKKLTLFCGKKLLPLIFLTIFTILILLFIHQQFGQMVSSMATQRAINKYLYLLTISDSSHVDFDYNIEENEVIPKTLAEEIKLQQKQIRQLTFFPRIFLPTKKIYRGLTGKDRIIKSVEIQEGILYNIIILAFIFFVIIVIHPFQIKQVKVKCLTKKSISERKKIDTAGAKEL